MRPRALSRALLFGLALTACLSPPRERTAETADRGYPTCDGAALPEGETIARGFLRAGPVMPEPSVVERFEIRRRGCVEEFVARQTWTASTIDLDVVYDSQTLLPLRAWKRVASHGADGPRIETRVFDLRGERVALRQRTVSGELEHWRLRGATPRAIIGPGRGLVGMWIRRAHLEVGGRLRESVLDMRESMEVVRDVTLSRLEDRDDERLGRVRVYTIYGREPIYTNDDDLVIGDLMGMVPGDTLATPVPPPEVDPGPADPVGTP